MEPRTRPLPPFPTRFSFTTADAKTGSADGIVITPSHNPPDDGGFKYDPPHGGPADSHTTTWIESKANEFLRENLAGVKRMLFAQALRASTTHKYDYLHSYVNDLENVIDMAAIRDSKIALGVDPLGGAGIDYWPLIAERYGLNLTVVNESVDPTFRFMTVDWDGKIRMDPSSPYAMQRLIGLKDKFDIAFASDTDHDRHGVVTKSSGLLPPNHYLSVCIQYLFSQREKWSKDVAVGKTVVSSSMIDRVTERLGRRLYEVPCWIQVVCRRSTGRQAGLWRGRKRRLLFSAARWRRVDHRQRRNHSLPALGRNHRAARTGSRRNLS